MNASTVATNIEYGFSLAGSWTRTRPTRFETNTSREIKLLIRKIHWATTRRLIWVLRIMNWKRERDYSELREREPWNPFLPARSIVRDIAVETLEPQQAALMKTEKKGNYF